MAVGNRLNNRSSNKIIEYKCGSETVKLSENIVRKYLVSGNGNVTDEEIGMFINLCRFQHLNPFLREAYLIKFGNKPAQIVVGKDAFTKRARGIPDYAGFEAGVIVYNKEKKVEYREGAFMIPGEAILGGWAKVYVKGYEKPVYNAVSYFEYEGKTSEGTPNKQWASKPATMIRKVALVQSLREAFPENFAGLYDQSEMGMEEIEEPPIDIEAIETKPEKQSPITFSPDVPEIEDDRELTFPEEAAIERYEEAQLEGIF